MNVELRSFSMKDARELAAILNNKKIMDNLRDGLPYPYTKKDAEEFIGGTLSAEKDSQYIFAIVYGGKTVGCVGVTRKDNVYRLTGELGYYLAESYWGLGIMTEAVKKICKYIFEKTDIVRVFTGVYDSNPASSRVLEKAGFELEGVLRKGAVKNKQITDLKLYAMVKEDGK